MEMPPVTIGHVETRSPMNVLGAKGMGDGSSMLTPAAIANAAPGAPGRDRRTRPRRHHAPLDAAARWGARERRAAGKACRDVRASRATRRRIARGGDGDDSGAAGGGLAAPGH